MHFKHVVANTKGAVDDTVIARRDLLWMEEEGTVHDTVIFFQARCVPLAAENI